MDPAPGTPAPVPTDPATVVPAPGPTTTPPVPDPTTNPPVPDPTTNPPAPDPTIRRRRTRRRRLRPDPAALPRRTPHRSPDPTYRSRVRAGSGSGRSDAPSHGNFRRGPRMGQLRRRTARLGAPGSTTAKRTRPTRPRPWPGSSKARTPPSGNCSLPCQWASSFPDPLPADLERRIDAGEVESLDVLIGQAEQAGLSTDGTVAGPASNALLTAAPTSKVHALQRELVAYYAANGQPLGDFARELARGGLADQRVAAELEHTADKALEHDPALACRLYDEALLAGRTKPQPLPAVPRRLPPMATWTRPPGSSTPYW